MAQTVAYPSDSNQEVVVQPDHLKELLIQFLVRKGMFAAEAETAASRLLEADLLGIPSHGSRAVDRYLQAMDEGNIDPRARSITLQETPALAVIDGSQSLGHVTATQAMQKAVQKAREVGTGTVTVKNGKHFGAASVYLLLAVQEGMIAFCTTSSAGATVAPHGSNKPATANNAFAWAVPTQEGPPFILDMACATASWGKVHTLGMYGQSLPDGWALDENGQPTNDPHAAKTLLPAAGPRGFGLAFLSSVLAGPLVGGKMPIHKTRHPLLESSEHFFYVINPETFGHLDRFQEELQASMDEIRNLPPDENTDRVRFPGETEWERFQRWQKEGIPLHRDHIQKLERLAADMKIDVPW